MLYPLASLVLLTASGTLAATPASSETKALPCGNSLTNLTPCMFVGDYCSFIENFDDPLRAVDWSVYSGDPSNLDFIVESGVPAVKDGFLSLPLSKASANNLGTAAIVSTTRFLNFGSFEARLKTAGISSVVTTFIGISNVLDEIDFEFTAGKDAASAKETQANWYYHGEPVYNVNFMNAFASSNTFDEFHTYRVDWTESQMQWSLDGKVFHTQTKAALGVNATRYPATPMRISFGIWQALDNAWSGANNVDFAASPPQKLAAVFDYIKVYGTGCGGGELSANPPLSVGFTGRKVVVYTPAIGGSGATKGIGAGGGIVIGPASAAAEITAARIFMSLAFASILYLAIF